MKVWVDLANSPHVLLFEPLVRELRSRGLDVVCTARDFAQTLGLARLKGVTVETVGDHGGRTLLGKGRAIARRASALRRFARGQRPDLAVSHNSYAQALAAWSMGIPYVTLMDYEHTPANHVSFRLARRILVPEAIPFRAIRRYGATPGRVFTYAGFKEQVYMEEFRPDLRCLESDLPVDLLQRFVVAVARPPADFAVYHRFSNPLFDTWLDRAGRHPGVRVVVLPRTPEQREEVRRRALPSVIVSERTLDGANLVYHSDLVVSAGGTMNREAAILGVPAYSIFAGRPAAVDGALAAAGRLEIIRHAAELSRIRLAKRRPAVPLRNPTLRREIVEGILAGMRDGGHALGLTPTRGAPIFAEPDKDP